MSSPSFQPPETQELQELLPAYEIIAFIEAGGMGAVYQARQISLDREVAIKVLPREFGADAEFRRQFEAEAKAMAKLNSPHLIGVYDFGEVDGMPYLVMEFVNGKSLHYSAHGKVIEQKTALEIALGIADGLGNAHDAGIIHRDIKPANVLLNKGAQPKIGDFGLARPVESEETDAVIYGTPGYTAPEVYEGAEVGKTSDVFSVGVLLYELLTGALPETPMVPVSQKVPVDPRLNAIIKKATATNPAARYADAGELATEIRTVLTSLRSSRGMMTAETTAGTPNGTNGATPAAPPQVALTPSNNWGFLRNLVLISILIAAIFGVTKLIKWKEAETIRKENEHKEKLAKNIPAAPTKTVKPTPTPPKAGDPTPTPFVAPTPPPETALEALTRLRSDLADGKFSKFPLGTLSRGGFRFFIVEKPMSWSNAAHFAQNHGGHLATCPDSSTSGWLASKLSRNSNAWIGGGTTGRDRWGWVDGSPWGLNNFSSLTGTNAAVSDLGTVRSRPAKSKFPFIIQWHMDGSNPGDLASQLQRAQDTIDSPNPIWPPGSFHQGTRHYLLVYSKADYEDSLSLAKKWGAHFAVPSDEQENDFITKALNESLPENSSCWLGGSFNGLDWQWVTGEPWNFATWQEDSPDGDATIDTALRFITGPDGGWDDADPMDKQSARSFLLEWSTDKDHKHAPNPKNAAPSPETLLRLRTLAQGAFTKHEASYHKALSDNGRDFKWELDFWLRGLPGSQRTIYSPSIEAMKARVPDAGVIPGDIPRQGMPVKINDTLETFLKNQTNAEGDYHTNLNKLRLAYLEKLTTQANELKTAGKRETLESFAEEIESLGQSGASTREYFEALRKAL